MDENFKNLIEKLVSFVSCMKIKVVDDSTNEISKNQLFNLESVYVMCDE